MNSSESGTCLPSEVLNSLRQRPYLLLPSVASKMINSLSVYFKCATPRQTGGPGAGDTGGSNTGIPVLVNLPSQVREE